jgi:hypothetical protein
MKCKHGVELNPDWWQPHWDYCVGCNQELRERLEMLMSLPTDAKMRKHVPLWRGLFLYFPDAIAAVANLSWVANEQHNPGEPLHWAREKSTDHEDCLLRHLLELGTIDTDGVRHAAKVAWRALAILQLEIEKEKADVDIMEVVEDERSPFQGMVSPAEREDLT